MHIRFKKDMWEKISKEMQLPWRAAEAMHWQIGEVEMAQRANVPVFHLAGPQSLASAQTTAGSDARTSVSPSTATSNTTLPFAHPLPPPPHHIHAHAHSQSHTFPQTGLARSPTSPLETRLNLRRNSIDAPFGPGPYGARGRADSARSMPAALSTSSSTSSMARTNTLPPLSDLGEAPPRYTLPSVLATTEAARP